MRYILDHCRTMHEFHPYLWKNPELMPTLDPDVAKRVLKYLLSCCGCQNDMNIMIGRMSILAMPREWVIRNIQDAAEFLYEEEYDDWEYRRLGEIYLELDHDLLRAHIKRGSMSTDPLIVEAAQDFSEISKDKQPDEFANNWGWNSLLPRIYAVEVEDFSDSDL